MNSILLIVLLGLVGLSSSAPARNVAQVGEKAEVVVSPVEKVKLITRKLENGKEQTWNVEGPNKGTWVDEKGKKIDSKNYSFKAPGTIVINKATEQDSGFYDYVPLVAPPPPPKGYSVDPSYTGTQLLVLP